MSRSILKYIYEQDTTEASPDPEGKKDNLLVSIAKKWFTPAKDLDTIVKKRKNAYDEAGDISVPPKQG